MRLRLFQTIMAIQIVPMVFALVAQESIVRSEFVNDVAIEVAPITVYNEFVSSNKIGYCFFTQTNNDEILFLPKDEYFCIAKMVDSNGRAVRVRSIGANLGRRFFDIKEPYTDILKIVKAHGTDSEHAESAYAHMDGSGGKVFYAPDELFVIKVPGEYRLSLQFQVLEMVPVAGGNSVLRLVRFPSMDIPVVSKVVGARAFDGRILLCVTIGLVFILVSIICFFCFRGFRRKVNLVGNQ